MQGSIIHFNNIDEIPCNVINTHRFCIFIPFDLSQRLKLWKSEDLTCVCLSPLLRKLKQQS